MLDVIYQKNPLCQCVQRAELRMSLRDTQQAYQTGHDKVDDLAQQFRSGRHGYRDSNMT
jgi:hypothetical protein